MYLHTWGDDVDDKGKNEEKPVPAAAAIVALEGELAVASTNAAPTLLLVIIGEDDKTDVDKMKICHPL